ncbi:nucleotidyltransferase domain-containing protein [Natronoflexus pectinivorans]|uniref:Putative nucleotidyltransferase-like protein n=1 Tax=Natronoflexus pectinivorans TaxID=682526 RepID=A0A4R2GJX5_9BACT|nr:nucleotidyltransferase family protein [Natronoflexus pectinivorans]TCO08765.1 putative nucleotidyltransferase-like protein [Natronoflexus pectinivorans]
MHQSTPEDKEPESNSKQWDSLLQAEEKWVIDALFRDQIQMIPIDDDELQHQIIIFARKHGLSQLLYKSPSANQFSETGFEELKKDFLSIYARNLLFNQILNEILSLFHKNGIEAIVLKGSFLSAVVYENPAFRPFSDIDILVKEEQAETAWKLLWPDNGYKNVKQDVTGHHLPPVMYRGATIEVHRTLFPQNASFKIPVDEVWKSALRDEKSGMISLDPCSQILYTCLHTYYNFKMGGTRLGWLMDIKKLMDYYDELSWDDVLLKAHQFRIYEPVVLILSFYNILNPGVYFNLPLKNRQKRDLKILIRFTRGTGEQKLEYSYSIAWERFWNSKGFREKYSFLKQLINNDNAGLKRNILIRLAYLFRNTLRMFFQKIKDKL